MSSKGHEMGPVLDALWDADPIKWVPKTNNGRQATIYTFFIGNFVDILLSLFLELILN